MKVNKAKNVKKNKPEENINLEDNANKVIELTRFNVRLKIIILIIENKCKKCI